MHYIRNTRYYVCDPPRVWVLGWCAFMCGSILSELDLLLYIYTYVAVDVAVPGLHGIQAYIMPV